MAQRLNITIPDDLHSQLEPLREQLNISKVCTTALQEAVERLAASPDDDDPRVAEILDRLYERGDLWYYRGYSDGEAWARTAATRAQLEYHAGKLAGLSAEELVSRYKEQECEPKAGVWFPATDRMQNAQIEWLTTDGMALQQGMPKDFVTSMGEGVTDLNEGPWTSFKAGFGSYLEGWRDAVVELWEKVARALKQSKGQHRPAP